jgi:hypothetical protein
VRLRCILVLSLEKYIYKPSFSTTSLKTITSEYNSVGNLCEIISTRNSDTTALAMGDECRGEGVGLCDPFMCF